MNPLSTVALIVYDLDSARLVIPPTVDYSAINSAVRRYVEGGIFHPPFIYDGDFVVAARKAIDTLEDATSDSNEIVRPSVIFFATTEFTDTVGNRLWRDAAKIIQEAAATLVLACPASNGCPGTMQEQLNNPELFVNEWLRDSPEKLGEVFSDEVSRQAKLPRITRAELVNELPAMMRYVPGSALPEPLT